MIRHRVGFGKMKIGAPTVSYIIKTFVVCVLAFLFSLFAVVAIMKPVVQETGILALLNPVFVQNLVNAELSGKSYDEIALFLQTRLDGQFNQAQIIERRTLLAPETSQQTGIFLRADERYRLFRGQAFGTGDFDMKPQHGRVSYSSKGMTRRDGLDYAPLETSRLMEMPRNDNDEIATHTCPRRLSHCSMILADRLVAYVRDIMYDEPINARDEISFFIIPVEYTPYAIVLRKSSEATPSIPTSSTLLAITVVLMILMFAVCIMITPMLRRVRKIEKTCKAVSDGNFNARINDHRMDSLGILAQDIDDMTAKLAQNFAKQKALLQAVSHEMRTPLSRIRFALEMLDIDENDERSMARLQSIDDDLTEIENMLHELGYFNYVDAGNGKQNFETCHVSDLIEATLKQRAQALSAFEVKVVGMDDDMTVDVDAMAFKRVIGNLLSNAARYAKQHIAVVIHIDCREQILQIDVDDDGIGIPEDKRESVFEPFVCLDKSRSKAFGGVGLGLAIVSRIMKVHGGTICIETSDMGGARMRTRWPLHQDLSEFSTCLDKA